MHIKKTVFAADYRHDASKRIFCALTMRPESADGDVSFAVEHCEVGGWCWEHSHDLEQWFYIMRGRVKVKVAGEAAVLEPGDLLYVPRNAPHEMLNIGVEPAEYLVIDHWPKDSVDTLGMEYPQPGTANSYAPGLRTLQPDSR